MIEEKINAIFRKVFESYYSNPIIDIKIKSFDNTYYLNINLSDDLNYSYISSYENIYLPQYFSITKIFIDYLHTDKRPIYYLKEPNQTSRPDFVIRQGIYFYDINFFAQHFKREIIKERLSDNNIEYQSIEQIIHFKSCNGIEKII